MQYISIYKSGAFLCDLAIYNYTRLIGVPCCPSVAGSLEHGILVDPGMNYDFFALLC